MNYEVCFVSQSDELNNAAKVAARHLGLHFIEPKLLASDSGEELSNLLKTVLPSIASVYVIGANQADLELVRVWANGSDCECFTWKNGSRTKIGAVSQLVVKSITNFRVCVVLNSSLSPNAVAIEVALLLKSIVDGDQNEAVPFERLYSMYFSHIQHESSWVNSRFMWFMFANSALIALYSKLDVWFLSAIASLAGLFVSFLTLWLTKAAFSAEQRVIDYCGQIIRDWKKAVPQIAKYILDTPSGGNSKNTHDNAQRWMLWLIYLFIAIWLVLLIAVVAHVSFDVRSLIKYPACVFRLSIQND